ncbi:hypothetical protein JCM3766R1_002158 [Sporobolomyces carnicolor]
MAHSSRDGPTLAQRRNVASTPAIVVAGSPKRDSRDDGEAEEEDDAFARTRFSSSTLEPHSPPSGLLLFRRRSSTNLAASQNDDASSLPIHPLDCASPSRRSSDAASSAVNPLVSGNTSRRASWSTAAAHVPPPSATSAHFASVAGSRNVQGLSPIEASPMLPFSNESTPRTTPESSVELASTPSFSPLSSSSSKFSRGAIEPFLSVAHGASSPPLSGSPRRASYSVIDLVDSRRTSWSSSRGSTSIPAAPPFSARSVRRQLRRVLLALISLVVLLLFVRPSRVDFARALARLEAFPIHRPFVEGGGGAHFLSKPMRPSVIETRNDSRGDFDGSALAVNTDDETVRPELEAFRREQLWARPEIELRTRVVEPKRDYPHEATVIMIHGLSQNVEHNSWLHHELAQKFPSVRWVMPQAPNLAITYHGGDSRPAWFDIKSFPWNAANEDDSDEAHYFASARELNAVIRQERDRLVRVERARQGRGEAAEAAFTREELGRASKRIVVGGFSQGGVMALLAGLTNEDQLGGLIVFSGMLPVRNLLPELVRDLDRTNVPVFWGHGQDDPYLLVKDAKLSVQALTSPRTSGREGGGLGLSRVTFETYEHVAHTWSKVEVDDVARWMHRTLGGPFATTGVVDESRKTLAPLSRMR